MRTIGVIQPNYLPWRGYFDFIHEVDVFVFLDDVQYTVRDWRNRNRIRLPEGGLQWLTVPILGGRNQLIREVKIDNSQPWLRKHLGSIERSYGHAPHFSRFFPELSAILGAGYEMLADLDVELTVGLCRMLGVERKMVRASTIGATGTKDDRLLGIVSSVGGQRYLSGPSAREYLQADLWQRAGIDLAFKDYSGYPQYPQIASGFEPAVSIIDLLFMVGPEAPDYIWGRRRQRCPIEHENVPA